MFVASDSKVLKRLVELGADVNRAIAGSETALFRGSSAQRKTPSAAKTDAEDLLRRDDSPEGEVIASKTNKIVGGQCSWHAPRGLSCIQSLICYQPKSYET